MDALVLALMLLTRIHQSDEHERQRLKRLWHTVKRSALQVIAAVDQYLAESEQPKPLPN